MSALQDKIKDNLKSAMKARNQQVVTTLRGVMAAVKQLEIDKKIEASDEVFASVLMQEVKKRKDTLKYAVQEKREDLIRQNNEELEILQEYLGKPLSEEELREVISGLIAAGSDSIGSIMGALKKDHQGLFDGKQASSIARELLA